MSIHVGIYDFFSFLFPGGIFIAAFIYVLQKYQTFSINWKDLSTLEIIVLGALAYLIGYVVDLMASRTWWRLFHKIDFFEKTMLEFNKRHPSVEVKFREMDWFIFLSYVRRYSNEMADESDRMNAKSIMLRNSSFGLFVFFVIFGVEFFINAYQISYLILSVLCLIFSIILRQKAIEYRGWFYQSIYQAAIALLAKPEDLPVTFDTKENRRAKR